MSTRLIFTVGIPASGKSYWAKQMVKDFPGKYKRVNKDDLRKMLDMSHHSKANESFVLEIRDHIIYQALSNGINIIVDDTNLADKHEQRFREIASKFMDVEVECKIFNTPKDICLARNKNRSDSVPEQVIHTMHAQFKKSKYFTLWQKQEQERLGET